MRVSSIKAVEVRLLLEMLMGRDGAVEYACMQCLENIDSRYQS